MGLFDQNAKSAKPSVVPAPSKRLSDQQRLAWLRLIRSQNVGPVTFRDLINHYGGAEAALQALPELAKRGGRASTIKICSQAQAAKELSTARRLKARLIALGEPEYPPWLSHLDAPPPLIYVKGLTEVLQAPMIAIVGSRNASAINRKFAHKLAEDLGRSGFSVVSGLARGIDTAAHLGALERGTVAVLGGGIDYFYPPENEKLQRQIGEQGALVTEQPPGWKPRAQDFPRRNRLISGMSLGVVVVEAARRSGSLVTARLAGEQGRLLFAVPGNPMDPRAAGTNRLIRAGAELITQASDIVQAVAPMMGGVESPTPKSFADWIDPADAALPVPELPDNARAQVINALSPSPVDIDTLIRQSGLSAREVNVALMELDLAGRLERSGANLVALIPSDGPSP